MYEMTGKIKRVGELQTFSSGFSKRELVVEEEHGGEWPKVIAFAFKRDRASLPVGLSAGTRVRVGFVLDGREWTDPKTGSVKCICDLTALKLEPLGGDAERAAGAASAVGVSENVEEMPF